MASPIVKSIIQLYRKLARASLKPRSSGAGSPVSSGKIVIVSQYYVPFPSTTSHYMTDIAEELARNSKVMVISGAPGSANVSPPGPGKPEIIEIKSWWPGKGALVSRSFADILFSIQALLAVLRHARSEDVLLTVTAPFTLPYAVALAARLRKSAAVLIMHDLYPDSLIMAGLIRASSLLARSLRALNRLMFAHLAGIIIIGRDMAPKLLAYPKVSAAKLSLIPNWASMAAGYREISDDNPFRRRAGGQFIVAMSGNAGYTHDPLSVLEAARLLQDRQDIRFLLSGHGVGWSRIKEIQAASPSPNVTLIERVAETELEDFLAAGDVWLVPYRSNNTGVSVPSRIYNIFAVGRPAIVCSEKDAEAALLLEEEDIGWVTPPENPRALADAILLAASDAGETTKKGRRAAEVASRYTAKTCLGAYRDLMERLLAHQRARNRHGLEQIALRPPGS
ncbi:glycosyltransferase family 4 protein [Bradyrhizobium sp. STM 3562]|uniref:glycosyltransferase family 4 protein n=1 Tax=Bradyrhizobium sp. STM 3562 TaxID=578924 RepID=UPI00388F5060